MNECANAFGGDREGARIDAENPALAFVPSAFAPRHVPIPGAHLAGGERQGAAPLALEQAGGGRLELRSTVDDAALELAVELLELPGLAIELGEHLDLGTQHVGDDRDRDVVDR